MWAGVWQSSQFLATSSAEWLPRDCCGWGKVLMKNCEVDGSRVPFRLPNKLHLTIQLYDFLQKTDISLLLSKDLMAACWKCPHVTETSLSLQNILLPFTCTLWSIIIKQISYSHYEELAKFYCTSKDNYYYSRTTFQELNHIIVPETKQCLKNTSNKCWQCNAQGP